LKNLVVDASVAAKVFLREPLAEAAEIAFSPKHRLHAPNFFLIEIHNVLLKKERRKEITFPQSEEIRISLSGLPVQYHPFQYLLHTAHLKAREAGCSLYDGLYLALAARLGCRMVTADRRLFNNLLSGPFSKNILWVEDLK